MDISTLAQGLILKDGIWHSLQITKNVSYPDNTKALFATIEDTSYWFTHRNKIITTLAKQHCTSKEFIDIEGGNGIVAIGLEKEGFEVFLIEPGSDGIQSAKQKGQKHLINATFEEVAIPEKHIENAGLSDVIEHKKNDNELLLNLNSKLKPRGKILLTMPACPALWSIADVVAGHYRRYTLRSITKKLVAAGFRVIFKSYFFTYLVIPIFVSKTIPFILSLGKLKNKQAYKREHVARNNLLRKLIEKLNLLEQKMIEKERAISIGSSIIIVAEKIA